MAWALRQGTAKGDTDQGANVTLLLSVGLAAKMRGIFSTFLIVGVVRRDSSCRSFP